MSHRSASTLALISFVIVVLVAAAPAAAIDIARDVSYPQCGKPLAATSAGYAVLGANGGRTFSTNPCLVDELRWAKQMRGAPAFYANTGNPGPVRADHWPLGQQRPYACDGERARGHSLGCAFDYGWDGAMQSFSVAAQAAQRLHHVSVWDARARAANVDWWLDVETTNTWESSHGRNAAAIAGAADALLAIGVRNVGVYSTAFQWQHITGGHAVVEHFLLPLRTWVAGFDGYADARAGCTEASFTGGPVVLTQYLGTDEIDADVACG
jgi:hypothetical protein